MSNLNKMILLFITLKISIVLIFYFNMPFLFEQSIFKYNDFGYYSSGDLTGAGKNIAYRWIIWLFQIKDISEFLPVSLALSINLLIDVLWIYLLSRFLSYKGLFLFVIMLSLQPYSAIYTVRFTTILFAKLAILLFCWDLLNGGLNNLKQKTLSLKKVFLWTLLTLLRNSNLLIAAPYMFLKLIKKPLVSVLFTFFFTFTFLIISLNEGELHGLNASRWPWSLQYIKDLLGIDNTLLVLPFLFIARVLLLFGAREKLFTNGIEPFLTWDIPGFELFVYILMGVTQLFGFCIALNFFYKKFRFPSLILLIPLIIAILTAVHQRYLIPFIPICLFGLALFIDVKLKK